MQFHQGSRLKKIIEKSGLTVKEIIDKSGVNRATLYNFFNYDEIQRKKLLPVLEVLNMSYDNFLSDQPNGNSNDNLKNQIESLKMEVELLREQLAAKDEIINLLKINARPRRITTKLEKKII